MPSVMIHQPEFMPWTNLFTKMAFCDHFVFLDNVQYARRSYQNRNKFKCSSGSKWLTVPVQKVSRNELIKNIFIENSTDWRKLHKTFLKMAYGNTSHYDSVIQIVNETFDQDWTNLSDLNCYLTKLIANYLKFNNTFIRASMLIDTGEKSDRILNICQSLNADKYICGLGSKTYLNEEIFLMHGIEIVYLEPMNILHHQTYPKLGFIDGLSVFDYLFNAGAEELLLNLSNYKSQYLSRL